MKTLVRDWILANAGAASRCLADHEKRLRALRPIGGKQAASLLVRLDEAQHFARTNVPPAMVGEFLRMALDRGGVNAALAALRMTLPKAAEGDVVVLLGERKC